MSRHMVEEAGSRFFEMASSLGRIHADTLAGMANATARTPLGPVFAVNASLARMANDGMETLASRLNAVKEPVAATKARAATKAAPKPGKAKTAAPFTVEKAPEPTTVDAIEPDVADVLVDDVVADMVVAETTEEKSDLTLISGIGATTAKKLNGAGVETFAQIAAMTEDQFGDLLASLDIKSIRFSPAYWIDEAKTFAA